MRVVIWGSGGMANEFFTYMALNRDFQVEVIIDNDSTKWNTTYQGYKILSPDQLSELTYDTIVICSSAYLVIEKQARDILGEVKKDIISWSLLKEDIKKKVIEKNKNATDNQIKDTLMYLEKNDISVFNNYIEPSRKLYQVINDRIKLPYIIFENKKMYFPENYNFLVYDGKRYVADVLIEQQIGSPHLYIKSNADIKEDGVVIDAGVCEGNFALRYIDKVKKIYLIESDPMWSKALEMTFKDYSDKVVICNKFLTSYCSRDSITLDELVEEPIDFLKMDIEGAEIEALLGGRKLLENSNAKCAICSYHKQNDEENIKFLLESLGYQTSTSSGYMFFLCDSNIADTLDFRRGIVYGEKR